MDKNYLEILASCEQFAKDVTGPGTSHTPENAEAGPGAAKILQKIERAIAKMRKEKSKRYPLARYVCEFKLNKIDRALLYFFYGTKSAGKSACRPEPILKFLANNEPVRMMELKLAYLVPDYWSNRITALHADHRGCLEISPMLFDVINGYSPPRKKKVAAIPEVSQIYAHLSSKVVGQEPAKQLLSLIAHRQYQTECGPKKGNCLLIGPTGCGKTYLVQKLAECLDVPVVFFNASEFTCRGYVGGSVSTIMVELFRKAGKDAKRAARGIIFLDEIDKITVRDAGGNRRDIAGRAVQEELLNLVESDGDRSFGADDDRFHFERTAFDARNVLWIAAGAFSGLPDLRTARQESATIGFSGNTGQKVDRFRRSITKDLEDYGLIPELLGRFQNIIEISSLGTDDLMRIMTVARDNPLDGFRNYFARHRVTLSFTQDALDLIARAAVEKKLGARGLQSILEGILNPALFRIETGVLVSRGLAVDVQGEGNSRGEVVSIDEETGLGVFEAGENNEAKTMKRTSAVNF